MQTASTAQGNYRFPVPVGASFVASITGAFNGATATFQFLNDVIAAGTAQVETATVTAAGGATSSGNLPVTFTSSITPIISLNVPLLVGTHTTAALIATAIAGWLNADATIAQFWTASTSTADVILTRKNNEFGRKVANDPLANLSFTAGLGVSALASSTNTTAGVDSVTTTAYPFTTTALSLTAAGEKSGVNCGSRPEINVAITVANPTGIVVNVNPAITVTSGKGA